MYGTTLFTIFLWGRGVTQPWFTLNFLAWHVNSSPAAIASSSFIRSAKCRPLRCTSTGEVQTKREALRGRTNGEERKQPAMPDETHNTEKRKPSEMCLFVSLSACLSVCAMCLPPVSSHCSASQLPVLHVIQPACQVFFTVFSQRASRVWSKVKRWYYSNSNNSSSSSNNSNNSNRNNRNNSRGN